MNKTTRVSGQAMVEFALVLPLILLIIIVFIDLGRVLYFHSALSNAVREGARYAIVNQFSSSEDREDGVQQKVVDYAVALPLNSNDVSIWCNQDQEDQDNPCDDYVTVSASVEIEPMITLLAQILGAGGTFDINASSTMQMTPYGVYVEGDSDEED